MAKSVREAMTGAPRHVDRSQSIVEAARAMRDEDVGSLPVVTEGQLTGMITDRDIVTRAVAEGLSPDSASVGDIASTDPVTVEPDQDLDEALRLMAQHQVRRLPVVEGEKLVGILAQADVALEAKEKHVGEVVEAISEPSSTNRP